MLFSTTPIATKLGSRLGTSVAWTSSLFSISDSSGIGRLWFNCSGVGEIHTFRGLSAVPLDSFALFILFSVDKGFEFRTSSADKWTGPMWRNKSRLSHLGQTDTLKAIVQCYLSIRFVFSVGNTFNHIKNNHLRFDCILQTISVENMTTSRHLNNEFIFSE